MYLFKHLFANKYQRQYLERTFEWQALHELIAATPGGWPVVSERMRRLFVLTDDQLRELVGRPPRASAPDIDVALFVRWINAAALAEDRPSGAHPAHLAKILEIRRRDGEDV